MEKVENDIICKIFADSYMTQKQTTNGLLFCHVDMKQYVNSCQIKVLKWENERGD